MNEVYSLGQLTACVKQQCQQIQELQEQVENLSTNQIPADWTSEECGVLHAYGFVGGDDAELGQKCNVTATNAGAGLYDIVFDDPHPDGADYPVVFGNIENFNIRDGRDIQVVNGTQTVNGFRVMTTTGDNGGAADGLISTTFSFMVPSKKTIITGEIPA